ncbi:MAG: response regulator [Clostridia bacterium]|nr:response regulator [Clostridia bacterium]
MTKKVMLIDDDKLLSKIVADYLTQEGYQMITAYDSEEAIEKIYQLTPDIILLDIVLPNMDGLQFCRLLRNDTRTSHVPIIMLTSKGNVEDKVEGLSSGADDYMTKPFELIELTARIKSHLRRAMQENTLNPLTGLPGNILIEEEIKKLVHETDKIFDVLYLDLDNFKAYNDVYGFFKGDEVIKLLAHIIVKTIQQHGNKNDFVGHIGGDDFIVIATSDKVDLICQEIITSFDSSILLLYNKIDRKNKYMVSFDRKGKRQQFPIMTLSIAVVSNRNRKIDSHWQVSHSAAELKKHAKTLPGSVYVKDRRTGN